KAQQSSIRTWNKSHNDDTVAQDIINFIKQHNQLHGTTEDIEGDLFFYEKTEDPMDDDLSYFASFCNEYHTLLLPHLARPKELLLDSFSDQWDMLLTISPKFLQKLVICVPDQFQDRPS